MTPPYADTGSVACATPVRVCDVVAHRQPAGFACLMIATAGSVKSIGGTDRGVDVLVVLERHLLAAQLHRARGAAWHRAPRRRPHADGGSFRSADLRSCGAAEPTKDGSPASSSTTWPAIHDATATSCRRHVRDASRPTACAVCGRSPRPRPRRRPREYTEGSLMAATLGSFFADARTIDGPPMSICSTQSSNGAPDATVSVNGYRLTTTRSNASMPSSAICSRCSGFRVSARIPAWTRGCSVFTRPSRVSGKPVSSSTGVTGHPPGRCVPPSNRSIRG